MYFFDPYLSGVATYEFDEIYNVESSSFQWAGIFEVNNSRTGFKINGENLKTVYRTEIEYYLYGEDDTTITEGTELYFFMQVQL